jgi:hypothetical protein
MCSPQLLRAVQLPRSVSSFAENLVAATETRIVFRFSTNRCKTRPYPRIVRTWAVADRIFASSSRRRCRRLIACVLASSSTIRFLVITGKIGWSCPRRKSRKKFRCAFVITLPSHWIVARTLTQMMKASPQYKKRSIPEDLAERGFSRCDEPVA